MNWSDYFTHSKGKLYWKVCPNKRIKIGDEAGILTPRGYITITLQGSKYRAHRIIWEMLNGTIPIGLEIDHINGIRHDNRKENLQLVTCRENHLNMAKRSDNTSGTTGVAYCKKSKKWKAYIIRNNKLVHLGYFLEKEDAISARKAAEPSYGFSPRHGL